MSQFFKNDAQLLVPQISYQIMVDIKVDEVLCINSSILIVYYTPGQCWQFRIISRSGGIFGEQKIYYSAAAALRMGLEWLRDEG
ncbi:hypothetical protein [Nostoc sp. MS1]|uniref:hypothetical protein n=1 Tax=Nostoc sp. MS1 TaxID=2764711 RepID=UPI00295ED4BB|nr:hypothetical protein [Nostoc sp. MS1]BCL40143.1 hypothetical protein NSMS1_65900 [Nostoc sp. MS1]